MSRPDVLGLPVEEAQRLLADAGVPEVTVTETAPPGGRKPAGPWRVVRQRETEHGVELLVAATFPPPQGVDCHD